MRCYARICDAKRFFLSYVRPICVKFKVGVSIINRYVLFEHQIAAFCQIGIFGWKYLRQVFSDSEIALPIVIELSLAFTNVIMCKLDSFILRK